MPDFSHLRLKRRKAFSKVSSSLILTSGMGDTSFRRGFALIGSSGIRAVFQASLLFPVWLLMFGRSWAGPDRGGFRKARRGATIPYSPGKHETLGSAHPGW